MKPSQKFCLRMKINRQLKVNPGLNQQQPMQYYIFTLGLLLIGLLVLRLLGFTFTLGFCTIILFLYLVQDSLLYVPDVLTFSHSPLHNPVGYRGPEQRGLNTENVTIITADNVPIKGWFVSKKSNKRIVVYFHQNANNIGIRIPYMKQLHIRTDSNVLLVAYRGYSDSQSAPSERGLQLDSLAVLDFALSLKKKAESEGRQQDLYVYGCSLGGAVAIYSVANFHSRNAIKALLVQNTFTSIPDMVDVLFPFLPFLRLISKNQWPSQNTISLIQCPILFIRSLKDHLVPPAQMLRLIQAAKRSRDVQSYAILEGGHSFAWLTDPGSYFARLKLFFIENQANLFQ